LIYPTAIGWDPNDDEEERKRQLDAWVISQRAHAVANGLFVISVNRVGFEADPTGLGSGIHFWGNSFVAGPQGEILVAAKTIEENLSVEIELKKIEKVRRIWPFFRDRRIDMYEPLLNRFND